jgi:hypothetical protein
MTVRQKEGEESADESPSAGDYFVLEGQFFTWYLSAEMAGAVDRDLSATPLPEWTIFVDLSGARIRVRTSRIQSLVQCTAEQRDALRQFERRQKREHDANRTWDEDD